MAVVGLVVGLLGGLLVGTELLCIVVLFSVEGKIEEVEEVGGVGGIIRLGVSLVGLKEGRFVGEGVGPHKGCHHPSSFS